MRVFHTSLASSILTYFRRQLERVGPPWFLSPWWPNESTNAKQHSLLRLLSIAHTERLDHAALIDSFANEHRGWYRRRLKQLVKRLNTGSSLVVALEQTPDALSDDSVLAVRVAGKSGTMSQTYEHLIRTMDAKQDKTSNDWHDWRSILTYWGAVISVFFFITAFLTICIVPTFKQIQSEFGIERPITFDVLQSIAAFVVNYFPIVLLILFAIGFLFFSSASRRFFRRSVATRISISPKSNQSGFLLHILSIASSAGRPLAGTLSTLAKYHYDRNVRQRLLIARNEVEQGVDEWRSMFDSGLLTSAESIALAASPDNRSRGWLLERLAQLKSERSQRISATLLTIAHPIAILVFGSVVLFIFIAFFSMNTELIQHLD